jgi:gamma-glutamyl:cysteine ligase YbdK (ATP-grasp superfamily)
MTQYPLFSGVGVEIEYMIVDADTLAILPIADKLLRQAVNASDYVSDVTRGKAGWSNEFVLHVIELKTLAPQPSLLGIAQCLQREVAVVNQLLSKRGGALLPGGAHPWMDALTETRLWPHNGAEIYEGYHRVFNARQHGYANVQSVHLNYPFDTDDDFGRLHAAIRMVLPLIPAIAAASPIFDRKFVGAKDGRLIAYMKNAVQIPLMTADTIPEPVYTPDEYQRLILEPLYEAVSKRNASGILEAGEWLNARGAIARFDRNAIEIRLVDTQEAPIMDMAIAAAITVAIKSLTEEKWLSYDEQKMFPTDRLKNILLATIIHGENTVIEDAEYLAVFGFDTSTTGSDLWRHIWEESKSTYPIEPELESALHVIFNKGTLATRIMGHLNGNMTVAALSNTYHHLRRSLAEGIPFE